MKIADPAAYRFAPGSSDKLVGFAGWQASERLSAQSDQQGTRAGQIPWAVPSRTMICGTRFSMVASASACYTTAPAPEARQAGRTHGRAQRARNRRDRSRRNGAGS